MTAALSRDKVEKLRVWANKRVAELEAEYTELKGLLNTLDTIDEYELQIAQLLSSVISKLRTYDGHTGE